MSTETAPAASMPRINEVAPDFEAKTTQGVMRLSDLRGKWIVLFSHPADFTPVCSTEFVEFARRSDEFKQRNAQLVGLSVDSVTAHIAWIRNMQEHFNVKIDFPVIADLDTKVAQKYGLIHPGASETATVRAVEALQTADANACATPANWKPGDKVIVPPPQTLEDAEKRMESGYEVTDWYFSKRDLS